MDEYVMYVRLHVCVCIMFVTNDSGYDRAAVHLQNNGYCNSFFVGLVAWMSFGQELLLGKKNKTHYVWERS